ncbi:tetraspanin-33-like [Dermatophagoides pteronyssinus]|uniref:Tetraspanin-33 n=1 Tax=Dermatophagoides pteronyssinus TaxID=6956 RepID=A0A6P6XKA8_DERPT|nr:tetraspanin-33-like [Dermatophagoides pteronyssinus]
MTRSQTTAASSSSAPSQRNRQQQSSSSSSSNANVRHRSSNNNSNNNNNNRRHQHSHLNTLRLAQLLQLQYDENFTFISPCIKYFLFFFNLIVWIFGCLLIGLGAWSFLEEYSDNTAIHVRTVIDLLLNISLFIIVFGSIVFIMSFTGCIGALRENLFLLRLYSLILLLMFIAETILSAVAILFPNSFLNLVKEAFSNEPIIKYRDDSNLQNIIDLVQTEFQCCGVSDKGYKDWSKNIYFECLDTNPSRERCAVPYSCCRNSRNLDSGLINNECGFNMQNISSVVEVNKDIFTRGCIEAITEKIAPHIPILAYVCIGIAIIQLLLMFLARSLQGQISAQLSRWNGR